MIRTPLLIMALLGLLLAACTDSVSPGPGAPEFPIAASLEFNLRFFEENYLPPGEPGVFPTAHGVNFGGAAVRAISLGVLPVFLLPRVEAALRAAAEVDPRWTGRVYEWSFSVDDDGVPVRARLLAEPTGTEPVWSWRCERLEPATSRGTWFTLSGELSEVSGVLTLHHPELPDLPQVMETRWATDGDLSIRFTHMEGSARAGEQFVYTRAGDDYSLVSESEEDPLTIRWNGEARSGSVHAVDFFRGHEACWDHTLTDVFCEFLPESGD